MAELSWPLIADLQEQLVVGADDAAFDGHFPGSPAFPGIAQIAVVADAVRKRCDGVALVGVRRIKYRSPIAPGARIELRIEPGGAEDEVRFALRSGDELLSDGVLVFSLETRVAAVSALPADTPTPMQPDVEVVLPHRGPSLFLERAMCLGDSAVGSSWLRGVLPAGNFLVRGGRASSIAAIEFACQAGAFLSELQKPDGEPPRRLRGFLAGVRQASFATPEFDAAAELIAAIRISRRASFVTVNADVCTVDRAVATELGKVEVQILVQ